MLFMFRCADASNFAVKVIKNRRMEVKNGLVGNSECLISQEAIIKLGPITPLISRLI